MASRAALNNRSRQLNSHDVQYHLSHGLRPPAAQAAAQGIRSDAPRAPEQGPPAPVNPGEKR